MKLFRLSFLIILISSSCGTVVYMDNDSKIRKDNYNRERKHTPRWPQKDFFPKNGTDSFLKVHIVFYTCTTDSSFHLLTFPLEPVKNDERKVGFFYGKYSIQKDTMILNFLEKAIEAYQPKIVIVNPTHQIWLAKDSFQNVSLWKKKTKS